MEKITKVFGYPPGLISLRQAAAEMQISIPSLRRWIREGRLGCVRCGRAVRLERAEITRFISRRRTPAREETDR